MRDYFTYRRDYKREQKKARIFTIGMIVLVMATLATVIGGAVIDNVNAHKTEGGVGRTETAQETTWTTKYEYTIVYTIPQNEAKTAVRVPCTAEELEELAKLAYLEAGAQSPECIRCVVEVVFNQLNYGAWGDTLHDVIYSAGNYEPAYNIPYTETTDEIRAIVNDVYENGISLPARIMFFRAWYFHQWTGAVPEFVCDGVYFSSSWWCK